MNCTKKRGVEMNSIETGEELRDIANLAQSTVMKILMEGRGKERSVSDCRTVEHHVAKACSYIFSIGIGAKSKEDKEYIEATITRLTMALYILDGGD